MWQKTYCETRGIWGSKISEYFARVGVLKFEVPDRGLISANWPHVSMLGRNREGARHTFHQICMESTSGGLAEMSSLFELKLGSIGKIPYFRGPQINTSLLHSDLRLQNPGKSASCHDSVSNITLRNSTLLYTMTIFSLSLQYFTLLFLGFLPPGLQ